MKWHDKVLVALLVISFLYLYVSLADFSPPENKVFEKIKRFFNPKKFVDSEDGAVMVIAALSLVAFLSVVSIVTDMGLKYHQKSKWIFKF